MPKFKIQTPCQTKLQGQPKPIKRRISSNSESKETKTWDVKHFNSSYLIVGGIPDFYEYPIKQANYFKPFQVI